MIIYFGKYKGYKIKDVPEEYLKWVLKNLKQIKPSVRKEIEDHLLELDSIEEDLKRFPHTDYQLIVDSGLFYYLSKEEQDYACSFVRF